MNIFNSPAVKHIHCISPAFCSYNSLSDMAGVLFMADSTATARRGHRILVTDRAWMQISGVLEVISFDTEEIILDTEEGRMRITGTGLQVKQLVIESGDLEIEGRPDSITYTDMKKPVTTSSVFSRIFR